MYKNSHSVNKLNKLNRNEKASLRIDFKQQTETKSDASNCFLPTHANLNLDNPICLQRNPSFLFESSSYQQRLVLTLISCLRALQLNRKNSKTLTRKSAIFLKFATFREKLRRLHSVLSNHSLNVLEVRWIHKL